MKEKSANFDKNNNNKNTHTHIYMISTADG
jgi:hypothetical protein